MYPKLVFFVNSETSYLGASADGIINCKCCGIGTLEVRCPYCYKDGLPDCEDDEGFCMLKKDESWA